MRLGLALLFAGFVFSPLSASAMQSTVWDFTDAKIPGPTDVGGLGSVTPETQGLHIRTTTVGRILWSMDPGHPVHAITLRWKSATPGKAVLLWHPRNSPGAELVQLPIFIAAGESVKTENLVDYDVWDPRSDRIGIGFTESIDAHLQSVEFHYWSVPEQIAEMWKSFWKFDSLQAYSINFLWGPVLTRTPHGTEQLWEMNPPPRGWSLNRILLPALALFSLGLLLHWILRPSSRNYRFLGAPLHAAVFTLGIAVCWVAFDVRMGLEILSYARHDYQTFISKPAGQRTFRAALDFDDVVAQSLPVLRAESRFAFLPPPGTPLTSRMRYWAYPAEPIASGEDVGEVDTWLVFLRRDITEKNGRLFFQGKPLTGTGVVLKRFSTGSLLFRQNP